MPFAYMLHLGICLNYHRAHTNFTNKTIIMKQFIYTLFLVLCINSLLQAQPFAAQINYDKNMQPGLKLELPYTTAVSEATILKKLEDIGYKPETQGELFWKKNTINGFYVFKGVSLPSLNGFRVDLYFDVKRKSRRESNKSVMSLLISKDGSNFLSAETDNSTFNAASQFLNGFLSETEAFKHNLDVNKQENAVKDAEKKLDNLKDDEKKLGKKIVDTQRELEDNIKDQEKQVQEIANQKLKLEELKKNMKQ